MRDGNRIRAREHPVDAACYVTLCLFRIVQEGLQNALKHSRAHQVLVSLSGGPGMLSLRILDDGLGFDVVLA